MRIARSVDAVTLKQTENPAMRIKFEREEDGRWEAEISWRSFAFFGYGNSRLRAIVRALQAIAT
jgi:hypothetical protein